VIVDYPQSAIIYDVRQTKRTRPRSGLVGSSSGRNPEPSRAGARCQFGTIAGEAVPGPGANISRANSGSGVGSGFGSDSLTRVGSGVTGSHYRAGVRLSRVRGRIFWCSCKNKGGGIAPALLPYKKVPHSAQTPRPVSLCPLLSHSGFAMSSVIWSPNTTPSSRVHLASFRSNSERSLLRYS
jgi:hypothetical protein